MDFFSYGAYGRIRLFLEDLNHVLGSLPDQNPYGAPPHAAFMRGFQPDVQYSSFQQPFKWQKTQGQPTRRSQAWKKRNQRQSTRVSRPTNLATSISSTKLVKLNNQPRQSHVQIQQSSRKKPFKIQESQGQIEACNQQDHTVTEAIPHQATECVVPSEIEGSEECELDIDVGTFDHNQLWLPPVLLQESYETESFQPEDDVDVPQAGLEFTEQEISAAVQEMFDKTDNCQQQIPDTSNDNYNNYDNHSSSSQTQNSNIDLVEDNHSNYLAGPPLRSCFNDDLYGVSCPSNFENNPTSNYSEDPPLQPYSTSYTNTRASCCNNFAEEFNSDYSNDPPLHASSYMSGSIRLSTSLNLQEDHSNYSNDHCLPTNQFLNNYERNPSPQHCINYNCYNENLETMLDNNFDYNDGGGFEEFVNSDGYDFGVDY